MAILENKHQKAMRLAMEHLPKIVESTLNPPHYCFTAKEIHEKLIKKGFVEIKEDMVNAAGEIATRATELGIAEISKIKQEKETMSEGKSGVSMAAGVYEIENIAVVKEATKRKGGGKKGSSYPFDKLEVGQSFFIEATEKNPTPWEKQSLVAMAQSNYTVPAVNEDGSPKMRVITRGPNKGASQQANAFTRRFALTKAEKVVDGVTVLGARFGRTA